jgi:hypothetical protein
MHTSPISSCSVRIVFTASRTRVGDEVDDVLQVELRINRAAAIGAAHT